MSPYAGARTMSTKSAPMDPQKLKAKIRRISRTVRADPRSVRKVLEGGHVRGLVGDLIEDELKREGLA